MNTSNLSVSVPYPHWFPNITIHHFTGTSEEAHHRKSNSGQKLLFNVLSLYSFLHSFGLENLLCCIGGLSTQFLLWQVVPYPPFSCIGIFIGLQFPLPVEGKVWMISFKNLADPVQGFPVSYLLWFDVYLISRKKYSHVLIGSTLVLPQVLADITKETWTSSARIAATIAIIECFSSHYLIQTIFPLYLLCHQILR